MFKTGRNFFDTTPRPSHVSFDDGKKRKRTLPWAHFVEAHWDYDEPDTIHITIGDWLIVISGHNIDPLYAAIDDHTLSRVRAHPEFADDRMHDDDSFVTELRFLKASEATKRKGQAEFDLGFE